MKYAVWGLALALVAVFLGACLREGGQTGSTHHAAKGPKADNSFCYVCHLNFKTEEFVVQHKVAGVGCDRCHGESLEHADDEDHITPPDIMFLKEKVNASCVAAKCHAVERMEEEIGHRPFYAGTDPERKYCTDCHGMHRIKQRQRRWDRVSRKLIWRDGYAVEEDNGKEEGESGP